MGKLELLGVGKMSRAKKSPGSNGSGSRPLDPVGARGSGTKEKPRGKPGRAELGAELDDGLELGAEPNNGLEVGGRGEKKPGLVEDEGKNP